MKQHIIFIIISLTLSACGVPNTGQSSEDKEPLNSDVNYVGALKNMMHKGDISSKKALSSLEEYDHLYALGACENLKGEIQVFDNEIFNTFVEENSLKFDHTNERNATLLVYADVKNWQEFRIPENISTYEDFEIWLNKVLVEKGYDSEKPHPFRIKGTISTLDWHVIDWQEGDTIHTHEKHKTAGLNGSIIQRKVELIGFFSKHHQTIFTHHSNSSHIHFKTADQSLAGHVDDFILGENMTLLLPIK